MSWAAHEFENYFIQKHVGLKASFVAICLGTFLPDLFTKPFVYERTGADAAHFHRGWPGVGFSHSLMFGFVIAVLVLAITRSRSWAIGLLIGQWAHVLTDVSDTAGVMVFFPFSLENITIGMWKHAASEGRHGDAIAYYSSLGGVWDFFWFVIMIAFAHKTLCREYFRDVIRPADPGVWAWFERRLFLTENGLLVLYRAYFLYGLGRMAAWFIYARAQSDAPWEPVWGGPGFVMGNYLAVGSVLEILVRTAVGAALFVLFLYVSWLLVVRRLWLRGRDPVGVVRGRGLRAAFH